MHPRLIILEEMDQGAPVDVTEEIREIEIGAPLQVIQALLGHNNMGTTSRYAHLAPGPVQEAATLAGRLIEGQARDGGTQKTETKRA